VALLLDNIFKLNRKPERDLAEFRVCERFLIEF
jgi:hypothetical protein